MKLLNTPIYIRKICVSNRIVMPPMATGKALDDGTVSESICSYYDRYATNGDIGLIITEHAYVSPEGKAHRGQISVANDKTIEGLTRLASIIKKDGSRAIAQISHAGGATNQLITGFKEMSASAVKIPRQKNADSLPKEMTLEDINKLIQDFVNAALRVQKAGFDGVEIHAAHGYLLNQFYSPLTNKRTDFYCGSSLNGRSKILIEIVQAIRKMTGDSFIVALRLGACDYMEGGTTIEDSVETAMQLETVGLDILDVSGGFCGTMNPYSNEQGYFSELTKEIKKHVSIPVILTGGILDEDHAERLLHTKQADLIGVGRAMLRDPYWVKNNR